MCRLSPLLLSRWEVGAMKQPYRSPESADLLVRGLVLPPQKQFHICSSVCPSVCGEEMQPCGLAAFHPIQLGLMGTFRYFYCHCVYMFLYLFCIEYNLTSYSRFRSSPVLKKAAGRPAHAQPRVEPAIDPSRLPFISYHTTATWTAHSQKRSCDMYVCQKY